jgi:hypothetical protein
MAENSDFIRNSESDTLARISGRGEKLSMLFWQVLSALSLLAMGGIHFFLVLQGAGNLIGFLFVLNAIGGLILAVAVLVLSRQLLLLACVLGLLFLAGTLLALVLALTVGLFGIREQLDGELVVTTLVVESIGTIVLVVTTALIRMRLLR